MTSGDDPGTIWRDAPRALTERERGLLDRLLTLSSATPELREQARSARVVGVCACGCPSVTLAVADDAPPAQDAPVVACAVNSEGRELDVVLHILDGRLTELEIWAQGDDRGPRVELPGPSALRL